MAAITISNLRISPYTQKNTIKPVYGDTLTLTFALPEPFMEGDDYILALDYERVLVPTARPLCALATEYTIDAGNITFALEIRTARFRDWVSTIKKPMPVWLQIQRKRDGKYDTLLLDDVLALPSVADGDNTVFPGDPLEELLNEKLDKPAEDGDTGDVLKLGANRKPVWGKGGGGGGSQVQSDWDESDSTDVAYIQHKPAMDYIPSSDKGAANGVARLDENGKVPSASLPTLPYIPNPVDVTHVSENTLFVEPGKFYDWTPVKNATIGVASGVDTTKAWTALIRLTLAANGSLTGDGVTVPSYERLGYNVGMTSLYMVMCDGTAVLTTLLPFGWDGITASTGRMGIMARIGYGLTMASNRLNVVGATNAQIDARSSSQYPVAPSTLDYAVRSVLPNVTTIPAATTAYSLRDASATTNNHSWQYFHAPAEASTYTFPAVTDTTVAHRIKLTLDFTSVQTYAFVDSEGTAIVPLFTPTISAGDVYEFDCEYSAVKAQWLVWPHKQGAVSDDYVMQSQVGAANGVAGLDANGLVPSGELPRAEASTSDLKFGVVALWNSDNGLKISTKGRLCLDPATNAQIDSRGNVYAKPIVPSTLNYAVTAALTDAKKMQLTDAQKASAQDTLGVWSPPVTVIPAATTQYTLGEGMQSHAPEAASVYALPAVTDSTRTHHITLNVYFRGYARSSDDDGTGYYAWKDGTDLLYTDTATPTATETIVYSDTALTTSVGTVALYESNSIALAASASFEDAAGNDIVPKSTPTIKPGTVVQYLCEWEPCTSQWVIMPIPMVDGGAA